MNSHIVLSAFLLTERKLQRQAMTILPEFGLWNDSRNLPVAALFILYRGLKITNKS